MIVSHERDLKLRSLAIVLDMEYRYWTYMKAHPAHTPLPVDAHSKAVKLLTWVRSGDFYGGGIKIYIPQEVT